MQHTCISLYNKRPRLFPKLIRLLVTLQSSKQNKPLPYYFIKKKLNQTISKRSLLCLLTPLTFPQRHLWPKQLKYSTKVWFNPQFKKSKNQTCIMFRSQFDWSFSISQTYHLVSKIEWHQKLFKTKRNYIKPSRSNFDFKYTL